MNTNAASGAGYVGGTLPVLAALCLSVTGPMLFKVLPLVVGAAAASFGLQPRQLGLLAASDLAGVFCAALLAPLWVRRVDWRRAARAALLVVVAGNLASACVDVLPGLLAVRFVTGLGEGAATGLALVMLSDTRNPDRIFGLAMAAPILIGLIGFQVLPPIVARWGYDGVVLAFAGLTLAIATATSGLPRAGRVPVAASGGAGTPARPVLIALTATAVYHVALGAIWAFIERMGAAAGLEAAVVGKALGAAVVCGLLGALAASALSVRLGRIAPLALAVIAKGLALLVLADRATPLAFMLAAGLFQFFWLFAVPYQLGIIASVDRGGRLFVLALAFQAAGVSVGPALAGLLVTGESYAPARLLAGACLIASLLLFAGVRTRAAAAARAVKTAPA
ncbi:MAG: hypothetical protein IT495_07415 [Gammaproteobacteria bacterium]|nr:hypothetical protein [Gammaproteobacteria bacterium]